MPKRSTDPTLEQMRAAITPMLQGYEANVLDVERACYWYASDYHNGQSSNLYAALSASEYEPGLLEVSTDEGTVCNIMYEELEREFNEPPSPFDVD